VIKLSSYFLFVESPLFDVPEGEFVLPDCPVDGWAGGVGGGAGVIAMGPRPRSSVLETGVTAIGARPFSSGCSTGVMARGALASVTLKIFSFLSFNGSPFLANIFDTENYCTNYTSKEKRSGYPSEDTEYLCRYALFRPVFFFSVLVILMQVFQLFVECGYAQTKGKDGGHNASGEAKP
jgi:hypothetical protein